MTSLWSISSRSLKRTIPRFSFVIAVLAAGSLAAFPADSINRQTASPLALFYIESVLGIGLAFSFAAFLPIVPAMIGRLILFSAYSATHQKLIRPACKSMLFDCSAFLILALLAFAAIRFTFLSEYDPAQPRKPSEAYFWMINTALGMSIFACALYGSGYAMLAIVDRNIQPEGEETVDIG